MTAKDHLARHDRESAAHDKQIGVIRDLVKEGMRLTIETRKDLRAIAAAQKRTDLKFEALIDQLRRSAETDTPRAKRTCNES
jgi:hypothetical protein